MADKASSLEEYRSYVRDEQSRVRSNVALSGVLAIYRSMLSEKTSEPEVHVPLSFPSPI